MRDLAAGSASARRAVAACVRRHVLDLPPGIGLTRADDYDTIRSVTDHRRRKAVVRRAGIAARASRIAAATRVPRRTRSAGMPGAPSRWDVEADVVSVGSGLGATSAPRSSRTTRAPLRGAREGAASSAGSPAFGGGEVFVPANKPDARARPRGHQGGRAPVLRVHRRRLPEPSRTRRSCSPPCTRPSSTTRTRPACAGRPARACPTTTTRDAPGSKASGRYLSVELFDGKTLGEWQHEDLPDADHAAGRATRRDVRVGRAREDHDAGTSSCSASASPRTCAPSARA